MVKSEKIKKFHIAMTNVPKWKIDAIAQYKSKKISSKKDHPITSNKESAIIKQNTKEMSESNITTVRAVANEIIKLKKEETELKHEYATFNTTKTTMLWLLQKSTSYETYQNHSLS